MFQRLAVQVASLSLAFVVTAATLHSLQWLAGRDADQQALTLPSQVIVVVGHRAPRA